MQRMAGRVVIVTGGGKGLGRAFALDLAAAGAAVVVNNRNRTLDAAGRGPADHVVAEILAAGGEAVAEHSDVTDAAAAESMVDLALVAVEGARRGVLTNVVLPYATTQMTDAGMDPRYRGLMAAGAVAPVVTALVDPASTLNGQVLVCGGGGLRAASAVEFGTVTLPPALTPDDLADLVAASRRGPAREYPDALAAFLDFAGELEP